MSSPYLEYIREFMYTRRNAKRTVDVYLYWIKFFIIYSGKRYPSGGKRFTAGDGTQIQTTNTDSVWQWIAGD